MNEEVITLQELDALDPPQIYQGYRAGLANDPDFTRTAKAYWHGFLNGLVDGRHVINPSAAQHELARAWVHRSQGAT